MAILKSENDISLSGGCWELLLGIFSRKKPGSQAADQSQTAELVVSHAQGDSSSPPVLETLPTLLPPTILPSSVDAAVSDAPRAGTTELKGLWREAYEGLTRDPTKAKLVEAYQEAIKETDRRNRNTGEDNQEVTRDLQSIVQQRFDEIHSSQSKLHLGGKEIIIRDQVRDVVAVILSVQGVVTTAGEWPGEDRLNALVKKADGLWIYASTAWRFICVKRAKGWVEKRLDLLLRDDSPTHGELDGMYTGILKDVLSDATEEETEDTRLEFQAIVGAIVVLYQPLSIAALSDLLSKEKSNVTNSLERLSSVILISANNSLIRLVHLSFPEFLTSDERCSEEAFRISKKDRHADMVTRCLATLTNTLRQDICQLGDAAILQSSIDADTVNEKIPSHVQYACQYWVDHLQASNSRHLALDDRLVRKFLKEYLLHWLECLSIIGRMSEGIRAVLKLSVYLESLPSDGRSRLCDFVHDIGRFVHHSRSTIEKAPLQVYTSALIYSPEQSLVRKQYEHGIPNWIVNPPTMRKTWSPLQQTLECVGNSGLALSPDIKLVASPKVEIWDTSTGTLNILAPLGQPHTVTFSHGDGKEIISLSSEANLRK
ncbi:hypothetical protein BDW69DRAFT_186426 [Aspergillus filifer]